MVEFDATHTKVLKNIKMLELEKKKTIRELGYRNEVMTQENFNETSV